MLVGGVPRFEGATHRISGVASYTARSRWRCAVNMTAMNYPAPPPQPPPYGYGGYGYPPAPPPEHPQATTVLVLGIIGFFCFLTGPFAWVMGRRALTEIDASPGMYGGRSNVQLGYILGIATTVIGLVGLVLFVAYLVIVIVAVSAGSGAA